MIFTCLYSFLEFVKILKRETRSLIFFSISPIIAILYFFTLIVCAFLPKKTAFRLQFIKQNFLSYFKWMYNVVNISR